MAIYDSRTSVPLTSLLDITVGLYVIHCAMRTVKKMYTAAPLFQKQVSCFFLLAQQPTQSHALLLIELVHYATVLVLHLGI